MVHSPILSLESPPWYMYQYAQKTLGTALMIQALTIQVLTERCFEMTLKQASLLVLYLVLYLLT